MMDELPAEFDLIVIGTGFPESCVAAAASRIGKTVLHIDANDFYGGAWASFSFEGFTALLDNNKGGSGNDELRNCSWEWVEEPTSGGEKQEEESKSTESNATESTRAALQQQSRRFNIDLCPRILYSTGELVQLLVSSNICRYAEFRAVDHVCTRHRETLLTVPCSRSDVFNTKDLNIIEKRLLMKFLTVCMSYGEAKCEEDTDEFRGRTFREYLRSQKVTEKITTCVMQAIAMCDDATVFEEGMARTQRFLSSLGRYGNTPFLFPMYGCGEIPQCFCRLCAVFGGVYCLKRRITAITIAADTSCAQVVLDEGGHEIKARHVVCSPANVPANLQQPGNVGISGLGTLVNGLSRGVFISASPLGSAELNAGGGGVNLLRLVDGDKEAVLIQLSHYSGTCPKEFFIFHLTTPALSDNPAADLQPFTAQVFSPNGAESTPQLLFSAYFTITTRELNSNAVDAATPVFCTAAPYYELDYDRSIHNARNIFAKLYGDAEFLPRAPDPEEIVIEGEDPRALSESNLPEDLRAQLLELEAATGQMDIEDEDNNEAAVAAANAQLQMDAE